MSQQGPFGGNEDKTVILPNPGGKSRPQIATPPPQTQYSPPPSPVVAPPDLNLFNAARGSGSLIDLASTLLSLSARLRVTVNYADIEHLKQNLIREIVSFESKALQSGLMPDDVKTASYLLCTYLDEVIQNTPWGGQSNWGHMCLLITQHQEAWGGERFYQVIDYAIKHPAKNIQIIELAYVLISFGFEGKYRVIANGANELFKLKDELYRMIQSVRGDYAVELSAHWQGQSSGKNTLVSQIPFWVSLVVATSILLLSFLGFLFGINAIADPIYKELLGLAKEPMPIPVSVVAAPSQSSPPPPPTKHLDRFIPLLHDEIAQNMVEVVDDRILRIRNSFASGSDQIKPEFIPMLEKIAKELEKNQDSILVTGHTDDKAILSTKFPSNWHLSASRAKNVLAILQQSGNLHGVLRSEGRADGEPLVANDTAEHRALNRRVDILIK